jgi:hypothetical protein
LAVVGVVHPHRHERPHDFARRATDLAGLTQPDQPLWNRLGYGGNAIEAVDIRIR